jgi:cobalt-zinc-cadmium efflux system membrane fusion protein
MGRFLFAAIGLALAGCALPGCPSPPEGPASKSETGEGAQGDICKEHGVLKAICPKCNPKLAAVFQAKGDWCAEHGLPESVCPICHPERGGRPAADVSTNGSEKAAAEGAPPADGTKVRFKTKETSRLADIKTARAEERKGGGGGVVTTARLAYDATRLAHVNARSPGVVRKLNVDIGAKVKKGAPLAVIESAGVGADRAKLTAARAHAEVAQKHFDREEAMQREGISSAKSLLEARQELEAAKAEHAALASALSIIGAGGGSGGSYTLTAPLAGVITRRTATIGKLVGVEELLFEIVDTSAMWAELDVPETELSAVAPEQPVVLTMDGLIGRELKGTIRFISPEIDPHTRTAAARVSLENPDGALRANMFGQARILVGGTRTAVMVPALAVQRARSVHLVFVRRADDEFEARHVEIGAREGDRLELTKGIRPGEEVVTQGSFLLKTETLRESIGAGCCGE